MKNLLIIFIAIITMISTDKILGQDWANLERFKNENSEIKPPAADENRIVFMGNSITEGWINMCPEFFAGKQYINRGIGGQTTPQMLIRFRDDVVKHNPKVVVILAGTNDIAGNTGPSTLEMICDNIFSMAEIAKANNIKVVIASVIPAYDYPWAKGLNPNIKIPALNKMLQNYCDEKNNVYYLDYFSKMADAKNGLIEKYTYDGVHPNKTGYKVMEPIVEEMLKTVLRN